MSLKEHIQELNKRLDAIEEEHDRLNMRNFSDYIKIMDIFSRIYKQTEIFDYIRLGNNISLFPKLAGYTKFITDLLLPTQIEILENHEKILVLILRVQAFADKIEAEGEYHLSAPGDSLVPKFMLELFKMRAREAFSQNPMPAARPAAATTQAAKPAAKPAAKRDDEGVSFLKSGFLNKQ